MDIASVIEENQVLSAQNHTLQSHNHTLESQVVELRFEVEKLQKILFSSNKTLYGKKSERSSSNQIELPIDLASAPVIEQEEIEVQGHKRVVRREKTPLDLPVLERKVYEPAETQCNCCGTELSVIGEDITTTVEYIPAKFGLIEHVKIKKACSCCKQFGVVTGSIPDGVIPLEGVRAGATLLSHIIVSKFKDHIPLNRQEEIFKRHNIHLPRQTSSEWVLKTALLLEPIYNQIHKTLLSLDYLCGDETTIKIQDKDKTGYFWGLLAPQPPINLVWFYYSGSRSRDVASRILDGFSGALSCDFYAGYNEVIQAQSLTRVACFAHVRRKFIELVRTAPSECGYVIKLIAKLYEIEKEADIQKRFINRQGKSVEILDKLFEYLKSLQQSLLPRHQLQDPISYALKQEANLRVYTTNPTYLIDNNSIEREIRPIAIGRKNYMFCGSEDGARAAAVFYTLMNSCRMNKVNPYDYIRDVVLRVSVTPNALMHALMPNNWKKLG